MSILYAFLTYIEISLKSLNFYYIIDKNYHNLTKVFKKRLYTYISILNKYKDLGNHVTSF